MGSLRNKLLLLIIPLCLVPLVGISMFSYYQAKQRITEDRIVLYLEQIAADLSNAISLTLLEKKEETIAMTLHSEIRNFLRDPTLNSPQILLNQLLVIHEVYDLLVLFDVDGTLILTNSAKRNHVKELFPEEKIFLARGKNLQDYISDSKWLQNVSRGEFGYVGWHNSDLIRELYGDNQGDVAREYAIGFAAPVLDARGAVLGGVLALMNWQYIQEILDKVEEDLQERSLTSGYPFMFGRDLNTVIGHKYRDNRDHIRDLADEENALNNYGIRLEEDLGLGHIREEILLGAANLRYEYPSGTKKISGFSPVNHEFFQWMCGVGINDEDIFSPVQDLLEKLIWATSISAIIVVLLTYVVARGITIPLKKLKSGASVIASGDLRQRVEISSKNEIGDLARTFNTMAQSLEERSQALLNLNKKLEEKVRERTSELEYKTHQVEKAYQKLKQTQVQLVQSEKMSSLGQLVSGIAHEIKNPLNFIYGNTDFLKNYVRNLKELVGLYEKKQTVSKKLEKQVISFKGEINYTFMLKDLDTLIRNFEDGAKRIHSIVGDLKTFSRMDSEQFQLVDIREPIELALNVLRHEYRDRISIHKNYEDVPSVECHSGKLSQVFMNLLINAFQAIHGRGDVWIRSSYTGGEVVVEIKDNGSGIDAQYLEKVFEPFFTTKPVGEGTGLGLSVSYGIIQQHHGSIEVKSRERGKGTIFQVKFPLSIEGDTTFSGVGPS